MCRVLVSESQWNSELTQGLRLVVPSKFGFWNTENMICDFFFPFLGEIAFSIFLGDSLNKDAVKRANGLAKSYRTLVIIVMLDEKWYDQYIEFISNIPIKISAVVFFQSKGFPKKASEFIWRTANTYQSNQAKLMKGVSALKKKVHNSNAYGKEFLDLVSKKTEIDSNLDDCSTIRSILNSLLDDSH